MYHNSTIPVSSLKPMSSKEEEATKIDSWTVWAIGVGSAMGGVFFGWEFVLYGGFISGLFAVIYAAIFYLLYARVITELSVRYQSSGGSFDFVMDALGIRPAIVVAIMNVLKLICANAATALAISSYLMEAGLPTKYKYLVWIGIYGAFTTLDCIGIKQSAIAQVFATLLCIGIVLFYVSSNLTIFKASNLLTIPDGSGKLSTLYLFFKGLPFAVQFFDGFEEMPLLFSYTKNAEQTMPAAINACYITILTIALGVIVSAAASAKADELFNSDAPLMVGIEAVYGAGSTVANVVAYLIVVGLLTNFFAFIVYTSQQVQAIAEANLFPRLLAYREVSYGAPVVASICSMVVGLIVTAIFEVLLGEEAAQNTLLMASIFPSMICYLLVLQCMVEIRRVEEKGKQSLGLFTQRELRTLGYTTVVQFYVKDAVTRSRIAQGMVVVLMIALLMLACQSFDYTYGLLVFAVLAVIFYLFMSHRARVDIRDEAKTAKREQEQLQQVLLMKQRQSQLHPESVGIGRSMLEGCDIYTSTDAFQQKPHGFPTATIVSPLSSSHLDEAAEVVVPASLGRRIESDDEDGGWSDPERQGTEGDDHDMESTPFLGTRLYRNHPSASHHRGPHGRGGGGGRRIPHAAPDHDAFQQQLDQETTSTPDDGDIDDDEDSPGANGNTSLLGWFVNLGGNTSSVSTSAAQTDSGRHAYQPIR